MLGVCAIEVLVTPRKNEILHWCHQMSNIAPEKKEGYSWTNIEYCIGIFSLVIT